MLPFCAAQVNKVNAEVVRLGGDKVKMLHRIRDFRKSINLIAWEHRYLGRLAADLDEHYKDLQLTRVTRNLQELLNVRDSKLSGASPVRRVWVCEADGLCSLVCLFCVDGCTGRSAGEGAAEGGAWRGTARHHGQGTRRQGCQDEGKPIYYLSCTTP